MSNIICKKHNFMYCTTLKTMHIEVIQYPVIVLYVLSPKDKKAAKLAKKSSPK
jgi:hypothetical protein